MSDTLAPTVRHQATMFFFLYTATKKRHGFYSTYAYSKMNTTVDGHDSLRGKETSLSKQNHRTVHRRAEASEKKRPKSRRPGSTQHERGKTPKRRRPPPWSLQIIQNQPKNISRHRRTPKETGSRRFLSTADTRAWTDARRRLIATRESSPAQVTGSDRVAPGPAVAPRAEGEAIIHGAFSARLSADGDPVATPRGQSRDTAAGWPGSAGSSIQETHLPAAGGCCLPGGFSEVIAKFPQLVASLARGYCTTCTSRSSHAT